MRKIEQVIDDIRASIEIDKPEVAKCYEPYFREILEIHKAEKNDIPLEQIKAEIEQLPTKTRTNWDGCCPDIDYPEIEYVDVTKNKLLSIIDKCMKGDKT